MLDKIVKYAPYAMALIIGMMANRVIAMLKVFTNNEVISNIAGLLLGLGVLFLWKYVYYRLVTKKQNDKIDQFK